MISFRVGGEEQGDELEVREPGGRAGGAGGAGEHRQVRQGQGAVGLVVGVDGAEQQGACRRVGGLGQGERRRGGEEEGVGGEAAAGRAGAAHRHVPLRLGAQHLKVGEHLSVCDGFRVLQCLALCAFLF